jgi:hypothetical protein
LCWLPRCTDRSGLFDFQFESALSGLGSKTEHNCYTVSPNTNVDYKDYSISLRGQGLVYSFGSDVKFP